MFLFIANFILISYELNSMVTNKNYNHIKPEQATYFVRIV